MKEKIKSLLPLFLLTIFTAVILALTIRGVAGNPTHQTLNRLEFKDEGPMELSPERGRFALTYSIVEDKSFQFALPVARFVTPDLGYKDGKYVSLFVPGVSFLAIPGYLLGKSFGLAQVGAFAVTSVFAFLNVLLIRAIAIRLGASRLAATVGALIFLFATPAFAYAVTLYQHHISVFLILASLYVLIRWKNIWSLLLVWFFIAASLPVDFPNFFMMFPIGIYTLGRIISIKTLKEKIKVNIKLAGFLTMLIMLIPLAFFGWSNLKSYGNVYQITGNLRRAKAIDERGLPLFKEDLEKNKPQNAEVQNTSKGIPVGYFKTRNMLKGFYTHFVSPDRGIIYYTPVILFGIFGLVFLYKKKPKIIALVLAIIGVNVLLYSMWGDPWGGWAFGSRYLIPSYALMSIFIALSLTKFRKSTMFMLIFFLLATYSISVNTLGALTTNSNPPKVEAVALEKISGVEEKYTFERNLDYLLSNRSKSFVFQTLARNYLSAPQYYLIVNSSIVFVSGTLLIYLHFSRRGEKAI